MVSSSTGPLHCIPTNVFPYLLSAYNGSPNRSVGQANFFSKTSQTINSKGTSIVRRLASRCVTGNGLRILIYQHIGLLLHIVWNVTDHKDIKATICLEINFSRYGDLLDVYTHLKNGAFKGLCDYVCTNFIEWMKDKIKT